MHDHEYTPPRWWPQTAKQERDKTGKKASYVIYGKAQRLEVSLLGVGTVIKSRKGCVVNGQMTQAINK